MWIWTRVRSLMSAFSGIAVLDGRWAAFCCWPGAALRRTADEAPLRQQQFLFADNLGQPGCLQAVGN